MRSRRPVGLGMLVALVLALAGCAAPGAPGSGSTARAVSGVGEVPSGGLGAPSPTPVDDLSGTVHVFAAASLKVTFDQLRAIFMAAHPKVTFPAITYDGSPTLVTQIRNGAPADVFASADEKNMDRIGDLVTGRVDFATNTLRIAVAPGNPKHLTSLADLAKPGVVTVICAAPVPCGAASHRALQAAGVVLRPASEEQNVTDVLTKVATGNADAGLVYATDINSSGGEVEGIDFPQAAAAVNTYPIAALTASTNQAAAAAFIALVVGPPGQQVLAGAGFGPP